MKFEVKIEDPPPPPDAKMEDLPQLEGLLQLEGLPQLEDLPQLEGLLQLERLATQPGGLDAPRVQLEDLPPETVRAVCALLPLEDVASLAASSKALHAELTADLVRRRREAHERARRFAQVVRDVLSYNRPLVTPRDHALRWHRAGVLPSPDGAWETEDADGIVFRMGEVTLTSPAPHRFDSRWATTIDRSECELVLEPSFAYVHVDGRRAFSAVGPSWNPRLAVIDGRPEAPNYVSEQDTDVGTRFDGSHEWVEAAATLLWNRRRRQRWREWQQPPEPDTVVYRIVKNALVDLQYFDTRSLHGRSTTFHATTPHDRVTLFWPLNSQS